jgi:hypothetical protein
MIEYEPDYTHSKFFIYRRKKGLFAKWQRIVGCDTEEKALAELKVLMSFPKFFP